MFIGKIEIKWEKFTKMWIIKQAIDWIDDRTYFIYLKQCNKLKKAEKTNFYAEFLLIIY